MSRPPRFRTRFSTTGEPLPGQAFIDYLPDEYAEFLALERGLATSELGFPGTTAEGDFAGTLMEQSALVAHVLSLYQDRYANEAFLSTAASPKSLVRHGKRLAYDPDPGLSATGHLVIHPEKGQTGTIKNGFGAEAPQATGAPIVKKGFGLSSAAVGEKKPEDYETLEDIEIDAGRDGVLPLYATQPVALGSTSFVVGATGLGLAPGDTVVVKGSLSQVARVVVTATEDLEKGTTQITVSSALPAGGVLGSGKTLFAKPLQMHLFGWDSSGGTFPDSALQGGEYTGSDPAVGVVKLGYTASPSYSDNDIYLAEELKSDPTGTPVVRVDSTGAKLCTVVSAKKVAATFKRVEHIKVDVTSGDPPVTVTGLESYPTVAITKTVTAITADPEGADPVLARTAQEIRTSVWLLGWAVTAPLVTTEPNVSPASQPLTLASVYALWKPGQLALLSTPKGDPSPASEVVRIVAVSDDGAGNATISWEAVDPSPGAKAWTLGAIVVDGNVVPISHGKTVSEVLGDSDGVTPFLRFALKQKPVTHLPSADGALPDLEVRVADVKWSRVRDFESSTEHDRVFMTFRDATGTMSVVFGDGKKGAIPLSGKKHITATYRIGIGEAGNAAAGLVSRIKKASPIVASANNPLPVTNGAEPADPEAVRAEAPRLVKTFDRAVSVADHRDLTLLFPGVKKARALWTLLTSGDEGVRVVAANSVGGPPDLEELRAFLQARRDTSVPLEVVGTAPVALAIDLFLATDPAYLPEIVKRNIVDVLAGTAEQAPGLFTFPARDIGQPAFLSEVYEALGRVEGVTALAITRFDSKLETDLSDTISVAAEKWLSLSAADITISDFSGGPIS